MLGSLDLTNDTYNNVESYATQFGGALKPNGAILINGNPIISADNNSKLEFQKKWLSTPLTHHQLNNFDCHLIPGTGLFQVNITGKVKFDESGKNRLNESADLVVPPPQPGSNVASKRLVWSSWFGFYLNLIVDDTINHPESINNFDYRITYKPHDSIIDI